MVIKFYVVSDMVFSAVVIVIEYNTSSTVQYSISEDGDGESEVIQLRQVCTIEFRLSCKFERIRVS